MCLEPYAIPAPGETIFSCTACSAVLHGECYKRFKESDRKRAQQRYGAQIEAHHVARPDSLCSPQVFPCTRCPECRRPNAVFTRLPRKRAKPIRTQKQDLGAQLVMLRGRQDRILELRRLAQHGAMSKTRPIWPAGAAHVADWPRVERLAEENEGQRGADRSGAEIHALGAEPAGRGMVRATCLQLYTRRLGAAPANAVSSGQKGKTPWSCAAANRASPTPRPRLACHTAVDLTHSPLGYPVASQVCQFFILMAEENLERLQRGEAQRFEWPRDFRGSLPTPTLQEPAD